MRVSLKTACAWRQRKRNSKLACVYLKVIRLVLQRNGHSFQKRKTFASRTPHTAIVAVEAAGPSFARESCKVEHAVVVGICGVSGEPPGPVQVHAQSVTKTQCGKVVGTGARLEPAAATGGRGRPRRPTLFPRKFESPQQ
jgi:hypothetical protein